MFSEKYKKFKKTITDFNLISNETKKIVIAMSGGKDANAMAHFLMEYQKQERPDIQLEMIIVQCPYPYYEDIPEKIFNISLDNRQKELLIKQKKERDALIAYWSQYLECTSIPMQYELIEERIMKIYDPCWFCSCFKITTMYDYLIKQQYENNTLLAMGQTKWDAYYMLLFYLFRSNGSKWYEVKKQDPQKYKFDCKIASEIYPKNNFGIPGKTICKIFPIIEFDDIETYQLSKELKTPILHDVCKELFGGLFDGKKRYLSKYLEMFSWNQKFLKLSEDSLLYNYRNMLKFMTQIEIIPPLEEVDGLVYCATFNSDFDDTIELLKK
jgi:3'-phosphoadenosine 5'-phosphosulfate sulfotransferase (PAPS reductase)/FAD synthetase